MATDAQTLLDEAKCYQCYSPSPYSLQLIRIGLWREILLAQNPSADVSPDGLLAAAKCYACYATSPFMLRLFRLGLLIQIAGGTVYQLEALAFFAAAGITDETQKTAINDLIIAAKANGWWDLCDVIYPFVGGNSNAHSINLKDPSQFQIVWHGSVTHDANGITGDGLTGYGDTLYDPSVNGVLYQLNSAHALCYRRTFSGRYFGTLSGGGLNLNTGGGGAISFQANGPSSSQAAQNVAGLVGGSRHSATTQSLYRPVTEFAFAGVASTSLATFTLPVLSRRSVDGATFTFGAANLAFFTVGGDVNFATYQLMETDIQAFQTALGRQV